MIRVIKPLRWFKLARIVKLAKVGVITNLVEDTFSISPRTSKTIKVLLTLTMVLHLLTCIWWLWKVLGMQEEEVLAFLDAQVFHRSVSFEYYRALLQGSFGVSALRSSSKSPPLRNVPELPAPINQNTRLS